MKDPEIRELLLQHLAKKRGYRHHSIFEEVPVAGGLARADLVVTGEAIECFEIKSERDSLKRLQEQGYYYQKAFEKVTLVLASKHVAAAQLIAPEWWGIIEVNESGELKRRKAGKKNPSLDGFGMLSLLNSAEVRSGLKLQLAMQGLSRMTSQELKKTATDNLTVKDIRNLVQHIFESRKWEWRLISLAS